MGNMLPCLVVQQAGTAGAMNPKRRGLISLKLLMKAIHKLKKRPSSGPGNGNGKAAAKIESKSSSSSAAAVAAATVEDGKGGEVLHDVARSSKAVASTNNNPKGAVLRSRLHHGRSGGGGGLVRKGKKGVVRVKVVLTKEEAARLLSLTVGGQNQKHTAAQIVAEMRKLEARRAAANAAWRPALPSIPEESS